MWPPSKLSFQVPDFIDPHVVLSFGDYAWIDGDGRIIRTVRLRDYLPGPALFNDPVGTAAWYMAGLAHRTYTFPCSVLLRRSALEGIGGFRGLPGPVNLVDFPTFLELTLHGKFRYHDVTLGFWRRHLNSLTTKNSLIIFQDTFQYSLRFLTAHPECRLGDTGLIHDCWERLFARVRFNQARAQLIAGDWSQASEVFRELLAERAVPAVYRAASLLGVLAAKLRTNIEPIMKVVRGYDLRGIAG